jgi:hypothetical protein
LLLKYDRKITSDYFLSPTITYTLINRNDPSNSAKVTIWNLMFPIGNNFSGSNWDWFVGPGIINRTIQGSGGQVLLSNGTGESTFSLPGRSVTGTNVTLEFGSSYNLGASRFSFEFVSEGILSSKRNFNLMIGYGYALS